MGLFSKVGKWIGDRWGDGPSMDGLKSSVKGTGKFALKTAPIAAGALLLPGVGGMLGSGLTGLGGAGAAAAGSSLGGAATAGGLMGGLKAVGKFALNNPDLIAGGLSAVEGIQQGRQSDKLLRQAQDQVMADAAARTPLRDMGMARLGDTTRPDLSELFAANQGNPYAVKPVGRLARRAA